MTNILVLSGDTQTLRVPFQADIRGTGNAEIVRVPPAGDVEFGSNTGDRIEVAGSVSDYDVSAQGNQLVLDRPDGGRAAIALNAPTDVAFADGSTTAEIVLGSDGPSVTLGGEAVGADFSADAVGLDASDAAEVQGTTSDNPPDISVTISDAAAFDGMREQIRESASNAWEAWAEHLEPPSDVTFDLRVEQDDSSGGASFGYEFGDTEGTSDGADIVRASLGTKLRQGSDPDRNEPDGDITFDVELFDFSNEIPDGDKFYAQSVFMHHIGHLLGFVSRDDGSGDQVSPFDTHVSNGEFDGEASGTVDLLEESPQGVTRHLALDGPRTVLSDFPGLGQVVDVGATELNMLHDIGLPVVENTPSAPENLTSTPNMLVLAGSNQTIDVPFPADVVGTGAAETVRVPDLSNIDIEFGANAGDRVEMAQPLDAYTLSAQGNQLALDADEGARVALSLNADVEVAFADGSAVAEIGVEDGEIETTLGGETVGSGFDPSAVTLDEGDVSSLVGPTLPPAGPAPENPEAELAVSFTDAPELDGFRSDIRDSLQRAWDAWAQHLEPAHNVTIALEVDFEIDNDLRATAGSNTFWDTGEDAAGADIMRGEPAHELRFGDDPEPTAPDGQLTLRSKPSTLDFGNGGNGFDAVNLFTHELGHVLGFQSFIDDASRVSTFEKRVDDLTFTGATAGSVPIRDDRFESHLDDSVTTSDGDPAIMAIAGEDRSIAQTEVEILKDIGLPVTLDAFTPIA